MCSITDIYPVNDLPIKLKNSIQNLIANEGYLTYDIHTQRVTTNGGSFLGELYEVDIKGITKDGDKELNIFLKIIKGGEETKWVSIVNLYRTELFAYRELSEMFVELQEDASVPSHEIHKMVKCYADSSTEAIILENIARKGFKVYDRMKVVSLEFAEMAIKELAKLHGLSFALQQKRPDYFNRKIKEIKYGINLEGDLYYDFLKNMINLTINNIDLDVKSRVEKTYYKLLDKYAQFFEDEATRRCICHGDYRSTNMMITTNNETIHDFIAVDYQFLYYGCPAMDIIYFIYTTTDHQFRKTHLSHLKDLYHETLTTFLGYFNIDVDSVYSRETFEQDFKMKLEYGLVIGFSILPLTLAREDDVPEMTGDVTNISFQVSDTYRDRQRGMIEEFIEWGYI